MTNRYERHEKIATILISWKLYFQILKENKIAHTKIKWQIRTRSRRMKVSEYGIRDPADRKTDVAGGIKKINFLEPGLGMPSR